MQRGQHFHFELKILDSADLVTPLMWLCGGCKLRAAVENRRAGFQTCAQFSWCFSAGQTGDYVLSLKLLVKNLFIFLNKYFNIVINNLIKNKTWHSICVVAFVLLLGSFPCRCLNGDNFSNFKMAAEPHQRRQFLRISKWRRNFF